jgi:Uma2 family endonuclease
MAMAVAAPSFTLEQFMQLPETHMRQELNAGELIEMPPPKYRHSEILHAFLFRLYEAAKAAGRFTVMGDTGYLFSPDPPTVRVPDVSVIASERLRSTRDDGYVEGAPEVAIEIVSPSETAADLNEKIRQYLLSGALVAIAVYPKTAEVHIYREGAPTRVLRDADQLELPEALPGWSVEVRELFEA